MKNRRKLMGILAIALVFGLTVTGCRVFSDMDKIEKYLSLAKTVGRSEQGPVPLAVKVNLDDNLRSLLGIINNAGVPVKLDLTRCTMINTEFNVGSNESRNEFRYLVSLDLPDAVTSVAGDFFMFPNLANIRFPASADINKMNPFVGCSSLTFNLKGSGDLSAIEKGKALVHGGNELVSYPSASGSVTLDNITSVGRDAFIGAEMENINLPAATSVGIMAFLGCEKLQTVNLPAVTTIGDAAFLGNTSLQTVNIPAVITIGDNVVANTGREDLSITVGQRIETIGTGLFNGIRERKNVTVKTPQSEVENITDIRDAFRGRGWNEGSFMSWNVNANINLTVEGY